VQPPAARRYDTGVPPEATASRPRQLLIGCDAMEWDLVRKWAQEGKLPNLSSLMARGVSAQLESVAASLPDTVWTTFCYGVNPGKLEKYFYVQYNQKTASLEYLHDTSLKGDPFWGALSRAGKKVGVVDVPHLPFQPIPGGFHLMNWGAHDNKGGAVTDPPELLAQITEKFGTHPVGDCERYNKTIPSLTKLRSDIFRGVKTHGDLFTWLIREQQWDVMLCAFPAAHCSGHHFWKFMDPEHPDHEPNDPDHLMDTMEKTYVLIDEQIGRMVEEAGPDAQVTVFAPHGMGLLSHASWNLNEMLDLWGFGEPGQQPRRLQGKKQGRINPWRILKMVMPSRLQYFIKDRLPRAWQDQLLFLWYAGGRKYHGRRAFAVPNNEVTGAIRIGVKGRDKGGLVEPGAEYEQLLDDITAALEELTDPVSGRRVVRTVTHLQEKYHGQFAEQLPDLTVHWEADFQWHAIESPRFGKLEIRPQDARSGSHTESSFLVMAGPGVPEGKTLEGHSILDLPATVLANAGVEIPDHLDGRPLPLAASGDADPVGARHAGPAV